MCQSNMRDGCFLLGGLVVLLASLTDIHYEFFCFSEQIEQTVLNELELSPVYIQKLCQDGHTRGGALLCSFSIAKVENKH